MDEMYSITAVNNTKQQIIANMYNCDRWRQKLQ